MNDKDKEAFEKWDKLPVDQVLSPNEYGQWLNSGSDNFIFCEKAWQAACVYKQKEIDELKNVTYWTVEQDGKVTRHISIAEIEKLQAENINLKKDIDELYRHLKDENDLYKKHLKVYEDENAELKHKLSTIWKVVVKFYLDD